MLNITNETVDNLYETISKYEKDNPGVKYGEDFPIFAATVLGSTTFKYYVTKSTMTGVIIPAIIDSVIQKNPEMKTNPDQFSEMMLKESPYRNILLKVLYLGYRIGKASE